MKRYHRLKFSLSLKNVLLHLKNENCHVLNRSDDKNWIIAWKIKTEFSQKQGSYEPSKAQYFIEENKNEYLFLNLSYDIKNKHTRQLPLNDETTDEDAINITVYTHVLIQQNAELIYYGDENHLKEIDYLFVKKIQPRSSNRAVKQLKPSITEQEYAKNVNAILDHIQFGNIYEMNYCMQFKSDYIAFDPILNYIKIQENAKAPFSTYVKRKDKVVLSASPERFLQKRDTTLTSQPIKGTAKRGTNSDDDLKISEELENNPKEIAENVMIVDLVRNDLSIIAEKKTVIVPHLCKRYTFETVHQLISTVQCKVKKTVKFSEILEATFPMGSMTGAPKVSAIKYINEFETFNRGMYSGAVGYISPNGNFDFNVIIRTLFGDLKTKKLTASVGGAITIKSNPQDEYNECLLKLDVLNKSLC